MRVRYLAKIICAAFMILSVNACGPNESPRLNPPTSALSSPTSQVAPTEQSGPRPVAPVTECPTGGPAAEKATGDDLIATTLGYSARGSTRDIALSAAALRALPEALSTTEFLNMDRAFAKGAFSLGDGYATVALQNTVGGVLSVYDVRPVNIVVECMPLAALVLYGNEGGDDAHMDFNMDALAPIAWWEKSTEDGVGEKFVAPYFKKFPTMDLAPHEKKTLVLDFFADRGAYTFDVLISYEINGKKEKAILRNGVVPFRVAAFLCASKDALQAMSQDEIEHMKSLRYQNVRVRGPNQTIIERSPEEQFALCP